MIVENLEHGRAVLKRLVNLMPDNRRWLIWDTETKAKPGFAKDDALVIGRAQIVVFSLCYCGESYTFPTAVFSAEYPLAFQWFEVFAPYFQDHTIIKAFHYANYDLNVFFFEQSGLVRNIYCTMIGAWKADASIDKGLKSRASRYNRQLRKTSTVRFDVMSELSRYAEEDVITTDELFQMQMYGVINRPKRLRHLNVQGQIIETKNPMPAIGQIVVPDEDLTKWEKTELYLQEFPYLKATLRAERRGFPFDVNKLRTIRKQLSIDAEAALKKVLRTAGRDLNLGSPKQLIKLFTELGIHSPGRTKKGAPSVNEQNLYKMQEDHRIVGQILHYRGLKKMQSVYVGDPFAKNQEKKLGLEYYIQRDGVIRASSNTVGAVTGRTSSSNPNLTQIPSAKDTYGIKDCFRAPKGEWIICLDEGQLELRVSTLYHQDRAMTEILCDPDGDLHEYTSEQFGVDRDPTAKQINFLLVFGGGSYVLSEKLTTEGVPTDTRQASAYIDRYNDVYPRVILWRNFLVQHHQEHGYVTMFCGRRRSLGKVEWDMKSHAHKAETTLANNTVQGFGQDLIKAAVIRSDPCCINPDRASLQQLLLKGKHKLIIQDYARKLEKYRREFRLAKCRWLLQVHDENIWLCDKKAAPDLTQKLAELMTWRHYFQPIIEYTVPLVADGGCAETWKQAKAKDNPNRVHVGFESWEE